MIMEGPQELENNTGKAGAGITINESNSDKSKTIGRFYATSEIARRLLRTLASACRLQSLLLICRCQAQRLACTIRSYRVQTPLHEQLLIGFVFTVGLLLAGGGFVLIQNYSRTEAQREFQSPATEFTDILTGTVDHHVKVVEATGAFFAEADHKVNRWQFFDYAESTLPDYPGVRALQWIPRVAHGEREAYRKRAADDGIFDFRFLDRSEGGAFEDAAEREAYFQVGS